MMHCPGSLLMLRAAVQTALPESGRLPLRQGRQTYQDEEVHLLQFGDLPHPRQRLPGRGSRAEGSVRAKSVPLESVAESRVADTVLDFSWEPNGERFAIVSTNDPASLNPGPGVTIRTDVSFYQLERGKDNFKLLRECV